MMRIVQAVGMVGEDFYHPTIGDPPQLTDRVIFRFVAGCFLRFSYVRSLEPAAMAPVAPMAGLEPASIG
jgi:hypothetical protein